MFYYFHNRRAAIYTENQDNNKTFLKRI